MSPPTEQLIRDYLNRLSVAARGQLGPDDRRALVNRTRDFIERKTGFVGPPTAVEVARLLSGLGDPAGLVQQERQRLAAVRGDEPPPAAGRTRLARVLRRDQAKARSASWHWPVQEGSRTDLQVTLLDGGLNGSVPNGTVSPSTVSEHDAAASANGAAPIVPAQGSEPSWFMLSLGLGGPDGPHAAAATAEPAPPEDVQPEDVQPEDGPSKPRWPSVVADVDAADTAVPPEATPAWQLTMRTESAIARRAGRVARGFVSWYRRLPLEATAVVLLGVGGASYPPLWLLGAALALGSRLWDYRDKWVGLALPLLLTVIGTTFGVTRGSQVSVGEGVHEGWVYAVVISRIAAALGAGYLTWRTLHGRRPPAVPPWNRPHKIS